MAHVPKQFGAAQGEEKKLSKTSKDQGRLKQRRKQPSKNLRRFPRRWARNRASRKHTRLQWRKPKRCSRTISRKTCRRTVFWAKCMALASWRCIVRNRTSAEKILPVPNGNQSLVLLQRRTTNAAYSFLLFHRGWVYQSCTNIGSLSCLT